MKKKYKGFTQYSNKNWFSYFVFNVNLFRHMNKLNTKLAEKGTFAHEMYSVVKA